MGAGNRTRFQVVTSAGIDESLLTGSGWLNVDYTASNSGYFLGEASHIVLELSVESVPIRQIVFSELILDVHYCDPQYSLYPLAVFVHMGLV